MLDPHQENATREDSNSPGILEQCIQEMGHELGTTYAALRNEAFWAYSKWNQYKQLYARSSERIDLLNQVAGFFFGLTQTSLLEDVILHLARLTDPLDSGKNKENLTLYKLPKLIADAQLKADIDKLIETTSSTWETARAWRNRHLAHRDFALAMVSSANPLPGISREDIEAALLSVRAVLNRLAKHYWNSEVAYQQFTAIGRDADTLVYYLNLGLRAEKQRLDRLERGEISLDDLHFEEAV
jgi:hypothetical protein